MSHFYADIQGNRGQATRQGTPKSGIQGHIRGWNVGVQVDGYVDDDGKDVFRVWATSGSNGRQPQRSLGIVRLAADGSIEHIPGE